MSTRRPKGHGMWWYMKISLLNRPLNLFFFQDLYSEKHSMNIVNQMKTIINFPCFFDMSDCLAIGKDISMQEVLDVLKGFSKDNILRSNMWIVEFYFHLFYLVGKELVQVIEETRRLGKIPENVNSTYVTLIQKRISWHISMITVLFPFVIYFTRSSRKSLVRG